MRLAAAAAAVAGVAIASPAAAVERENHLGLDVGTAILGMSDKTDVGGAFGAHWAYGLTDEFNLMAEGTFSLVSPGESIASAATPRTRPATAANAGVGIAYVFDILRWVPYAGVLAEGYALMGGTLPNTTWIPGGAIAVGLDYRLDRTLAVGVAFRQHLLATDTATYPSFTQVFARVEYTWGW
ncbi:MAG TPA: outer membrane beta-barrel protein [Polyangiaceae bacterium]